MLYFPIYDFYWPEWVPYMGGEYFMFFSPVFNIADSSIFMGVITILFSQKRFFKEHSEGENQGSTKITMTETSISQSEEVIVTYSEKDVEEQPFSKDEYQSPQETPEQEGPATESERSA